MRSQNILLSFCHEQNLVFKSAISHFTLSIKWACDYYKFKITFTGACRPYNIVM